MKAPWSNATSNEFDEYGAASPIYYAFAIGRRADACAMVSSRQLHAIIAGGAARLPDRAWAIRVSFLA
jgi:hypothetical protein